MRTLTFFFSIVLGCLAVSAAERVTRVTIATRPRFVEHRGLYTCLVIADDKHSYEIYWALHLPKEVQFFPISLDTNLVYTFTVAEEPNERFKNDIRLPKLRRVQQGNQTIYDLEVCEVHKTKMDHKQVEIVYGLILPGPDEPSANTEQRLFPHRREYWLGGCASGPDSPKTEKVYVCTECKKAYEKWKSEDKKTK
jgi:hypothetical protein